jgi:hypothetical protein
MHATGQKITVKWKRPQDDKESTDTFKISVNATPQEEESGGSTNPDTQGPGGTVNPGL